MGKIVRKVLPNASMPRYYDIWCFYESEEKKARVIKKHLELEEARNYLKDHEHSSYTAKSPKGCEGNEAKIKRWHEKKKHWFYGMRASI